jgi:hypothetical protein
VIAGGDILSNRPDAWRRVLGMATGRIFVETQLSLDSRHNYPSPIIGEGCPGLPFGDVNRLPNPLFGAQLNQVCEG